MASILSQLQCVNHCSPHGIVCHTAISIICYTTNIQPCNCEIRSWIENELIELINSDQLRISIPIQFQIFRFNSNSIHAELNWIDYQFQFNSWIDPSTVITIHMRGTRYPGITRSMSWLLMPWLLASPRHQQPWYWLYKIYKSLSYMQEGFHLPVPCHCGGMV